MMACSWKHKSRVDRSGLFRNSPSFFCSLPASLLPSFLPNCRSRRHPNPHPHPFLPPQSRPDSLPTLLPFRPPSFFPAFRSASLPSFLLPSFPPSYLSSLFSLPSLCSSLPSLRISLFLCPPPPSLLSSMPSLPASFSSSLPSLPFQSMSPALLPHTPPFHLFLLGPLSLLPPPRRVQARATGVRFFQKIDRKKVQKIFKMVRLGRSRPQASHVVNLIVPCQDGSRCAPQTGRGVTPRSQACAVDGSKRAP